MRNISKIKTKGKKKFYKKALFFYFLFSFKFLGSIVFRGKKKLAYKIWSNFKYYLKLLSDKNPVSVFYRAMLNITPKILLYKKRFGAVKKEIPMPLYGRKKITYAIKSIFKVIKEKHKSVKAKDLAELIFDSFNNRGAVISLKKNTYAIALRNKFLLELIKR